MNKKFYKVTDIEGKIFSLAEVGTEGATIAEYNSAQGRVNLRAVDHFNSNDFTGKVTQIEAEEYDAALGAWGFASGNTAEDKANAEETAAGTATGNADTGASAEESGAGANLTGDAVDSIGGIELTTISTGEQGNGIGASGATTEGAPESQGTDTQADAEKTADGTQAA